METNNIGDMTNKISDERLRELIDEKRLEYTRAETWAQEGINREIEALLELQTARQTLADQSALIGELKADGKWLHQSLCAYLDYADDFLRGKCYDPLGAIENHVALLKKMEVMG